MKIPQHRFVIDFTGFTESGASHRSPLAFQHLPDTVAVVRRKVANEKGTPDAISYADKWWLFAKARVEFSNLKKVSKRFIGTTETTKFRVFQFIDTDIVIDHMIIGIGLDDYYSLGVLSSAAHLAWTMNMSGMMGVATLAQGHRYTKSEIFDTFPFPNPASGTIANISSLSEDLDTHRRAALAEVPGLTMTELYNFRDKLRSGVTLSKADQDRAMAARAGIVNRLHEQIDAAVAEAYGWPADLPPSEIIARLVALNAERAAEEAAGHVRWLRPDYQKPLFEKKSRKAILPI